MIRQAVSCDICGTEKQHTNHWFVASDQGAELRICAWSSRASLRAGAKHLCGQICLHKLVDDFMARTLSARTQPAAEAKSAAKERVPHSAAVPTDASLTSASAYAVPVRTNPATIYNDEFESSARLIPSPDPALPMRPASVALPAAPAGLVAGQHDALVDEQPGNSSRNWRAEAWKRERERELRATNRLPAGRRRSIA